LKYPIEIDIRELDESVINSTLSISKNMRIGLAAAIVALLAFVSFVRSLSVGFLSDDRQQLAYIYGYLHTQPLALLMNFTSAWMQEPVWGCHYRPLMLLPLVFDTAVWNLNPFGWHLTTIAIHVGCSVLVFFLAAELLKKLASSTGMLIPFLAATLFAVHPHHAEAVIWICGRVDSCATLFYLSSFLTFLYSLDAGNSRSKIYRLASLILCAGSLFTKEVGATLPVVLTWFALCVEVGRAKWSRALFSAFKVTRAYWVLLALYLICRTLSLGTLLGGYEGFGSVALNDVWLSGLFTWKFVSGIFLPVQLPQVQELGSVITLLNWFYGALTLILIARLVFFREHLLLRPSVFLLGWIVAGMAIVARVWYASSGLPGGRHFYLVSVPYCILFVLLFVPGQTKGKAEKRLKQLAAGVVSVYCLLFCALTLKTQDLWLDESKYEAAIESGIVKLAEQNPQAAGLVFVAAPMTHHHIGLYPSFANLQGCMKAPLCVPDLSTKIAALRSHFFNFDLVNKSELMKVLKEPNTIAFGFDGDKREICQIAPDYFDDPQDGRVLESTRELSPKLLSHEFNIATYSLGLDDSFRKGQFDCLEVTAVAPVSPNAEEANIVLSWNQNLDSMNRGILPLYKLNNGSNTLWRLDNADGFASILSSRLIADGKPHTYRFNVSEIASWILLAKPSDAQLLVSPGKTKFESVRFLNLQNEIPKLSAASTYWVREQSGRMAPKSSNALVLNYDATMLPGASYVMAEISRPFEYFDYFDSSFRQSVLSGRSMKKYSLDKLKGEMELWPDDFKKSGEYDVRIAAFDKDGKLLGYVSDPITLHI